MREYDNVDYRYSSQDGGKEKAIDFISAFLGFTPEFSTLVFDLNFFSGGIGVHDRLAFSCNATIGQLEKAVEKRHLIVPAAIEANLECGEDFEWLVNSAGVRRPIEESCLDFLNAEKREFQDPCTAKCQMHFAQFSNVNTWTAVWGEEGRLNCLHYDQG